MGNLSNPVITRLGKNIFWNRLNYRDFRTYLLLQQDQLINYLLFFSVHYSCYNYWQIFFNKYWQSKLSAIYQLQIVTLPALYYQSREIKNEHIDIKISYLHRLQQLIIYPSRLWILRYQKWIIVNWFLFKPSQLRTVHTRQLQFMDYFAIPQTRSTLKRLYYLTFFHLHHLRTYQHFM